MDLRVTRAQAVSSRVDDVGKREYVCGALRRLCSSAAVRLTRDELRDDDVICVIGVSDCFGEVSSHDRAEIVVER